MGMFGRKRSEANEAAPAQAALGGSIPDYGFNQSHAAAPSSSSPKGANGLDKITSYPGDMGGRAKFTGHARTTSYQQASVYNRRTYDTVN